MQADARSYSTPSGCGGVTRRSEHGAAPGIWRALLNGRYVYDSLKRAAARNHRSLNGEVLARLEASIRPAAVAAEDILARVASRSASLCLPELGEDLLKALKDAGRP